MSASNDDSTPWGPVWVSNAIARDSQYTVQFLLDVGSNRIAGVVNEEPAGEASPAGNLHGETDGSAVGGISGWTRFGTNETASAGTNSFSGWLSEVTVFDAVTNLSDYLRTHSGMGVACDKCGGDGTPGSTTASSTPCPFDPTGPTEANVHMSGNVSLSMTNYIYYNHDDDNVNTTNDVDDIGPVNDENDLVMVEVGIGLKAGEYPGTWTFLSVIGDDHVSVWDNSNKSGTAVSLPVTWQITGPSPGSTGYSTSHVYWVEGIKTSDVPHDVWFRTSYRGTDPDVTRYCWTTESNTVFDSQFLIYVDQPGAGGDRDTYEPSLSGAEVGHTSWRFECSPEEVVPTALQVYANQHIGYYPATVIKPFSRPAAEGLFIMPDTTHLATHEVDYSWAISMKQLLDGLAYCKALEDSPGTYDLCTNNCTDAAINAGSAAGIAVPDTQGTWPGGGGSNPGDLGEDLRSLQQ